MEILIDEILQEGMSIEKETVWLKCKAGGNKIVAFWGEFGSPNRNIAALRQQKLPFVVDILSPEECVPTKWEVDQYGLSWSVPSNSYIQINPEF